MSEPTLESPSYRTDARDRSRHVVVAGLLAALLASAAWISLPVGTVPLTLQVFVVVLVALLLPPRWAAATIGVYLLLGALGAPVFASGRAGLGVLFGPTGGYLFGFLVGATLGAAHPSRSRAPRRTRRRRRHCGRARHRARHLRAGLGAARGCHWRGRVGIVRHRRRAIHRSRHSEGGSRGSGCVSAEAGRGRAQLAAQLLGSAARQVPKYF